MSKSTLDSLEKLLAKYITPIELKFATVIKELQRLEEKIDRIEARSNAPLIEDEGKPNTDEPTSKQRTGTAAAAPSPTLAAPDRPPAPGQGRVTVGVGTRHTRTGTYTSTTPTTIAAIVQGEPGRIRPNAVTTPSGTSSSSSRQLISPHQPAPAVKSQQGTCALAQASTEANDKRNKNAYEWQTVGENRYNKRRTQRRAVIKGSGSASSELRTITRVKKLHACFFKPETTVESMLSYMKNKKPNDDYHIEKLKLNHSYYSSFVLTVPCDLFDFFTTAENWPLGTEISEWFRRSGGRAGAASTSLPQHSSRHSAGRDQDGTAH